MFIILRNLCVNQCAEDNKSKFSAALNAIKHHFYIDDYITSLSTISEAKKFISQTKRCLKNGAFRLTKLVSNETEVLTEIASDDKDETKRDHKSPWSKMEHNN